MKIDRTVAERVLRAEAKVAASGPVDAAWRRKIEQLSKLCDEGVSKTHLAFMGTALLAKSVSRRADLFAIKPDHAPDNPNAFSARSLAHGVLVPLAAELGFSIGVTGREPLNNQPYFRMVRLDDGTPVHAGGRAAFDYMVELVRELQELGTEAEAREALRAFIAVRSTYVPRYAEAAEGPAITPEALTAAVRALVMEQSEGGRRAQAVAAGFFDVFAGPDRVESGRINDPSRKYPGDVNVRTASDSERFEKAVEVRDKPVSTADVQIFGQKCVALGVQEAAVLMVAEGQPKLDISRLGAWAIERGLSLTLFHGWPEFVEQALFWSEQPKLEAANLTVGYIEARLIAVEASPQAVESWRRLVKAGAKTRAEELRISTPM